LAYRLAGKDTSELLRIPDLIEQTIEMVTPQIEAIAKDINGWNDMYCLGYGATYPIALEGALKLKEITYAHCEGMLSTEFKHGPLSAVSKGFPIISLPRDRTMCRSSSAASMKSKCAARAPSQSPKRMPACEPTAMIWW
jgi:glucosamine 6-phosphate synthetase-like amidotransferase/phosphosugar isomerase protein